jgi:hypothetical protein
VREFRRELESARDYVKLRKGCAAAPSSSSQQVCGDDYAPQSNNMFADDGSGESMTGPDAAASIKQPSATVWRDIYSPGPKHNITSGNSSSSGNDGQVGTSVTAVEAADAAAETALGVIEAALSLPPLELSVNFRSPSVNSDISEALSEVEDEANPEALAVDCKDRSVLAYIRLFMGISGPYNLHYICTHMHRRGLDVSIIEKIFNHDLRKYSPSYMLCDLVEEFSPSASFQSLMDSMDSGIDEAQVASGVEVSHEAFSTEKLANADAVATDDSDIGALSETELAEVVSRMLSVRQAQFEFDNQGFEPADGPGSDMNSSVSNFSPTPSIAGASIGSSFVAQYSKEVKSTDMLPLFSYFPPVFLFHGNQDRTIPPEVWMTAGKFVVDYLLS